MAIRADFHVHPLLNKWLLGRDPALRHGSPPVYFPLLNYVDYPRTYDAKLRLICSVIYVLPLPGRPMMREVEQLIRFTQEGVGRSPVPIRVVRTAEEVRRASQENALAIIHVVEGGHVVGGDEDNVERLADMGVRYITLVHFVHNRIGGAASMPFGGEQGLTEFGRRVVRRMYRHGIIADLSHATVQTFWDVLEEASGPVAATHSGARVYSMGERNLDADQAKAIAETGGVIGVILCPFYLKAWRIQGSVKDLVDNISYFVDLVGPEHVAIGSDLDGWIWPVSEVRDITDNQRIVEALTHSGFNDRDIDLIMGENIVRMLERMDESMRVKRATTTGSLQR